VSPPPGEFLDVIHWLRERGVPLQVIEKVIVHLENSPAVRWATIRFEPSLFVHWHNERGSGPSLRDLVEAAREGRLDEVEM